MLKVLLLSVIFIAAATAPAAEVYRWVDDQGVVHYSDRPSEGADRLTIDAPQTIRAPVPQRRPNRSSQDENAGETAEIYETLEIVSPGQEEILWNIGGQLSVAIQLQPRLQRGHRLDLYLDGEQVASPRTTRAILSDVFRGTHTLTAEVKDASDQVLIKSRPRTFSVQQTSIQNPNNPNVAPVTPPAPGSS